MLLQMYLREAMLDLIRGKSLNDTMYHVNHCYDVLRQAIICRADDMPLFFPGGTTETGDNQLRRCGDWDALTDWAVENTACYPTLSC